MFLIFFYGCHIEYCQLKNGYWNACDDFNVFKNVTLFGLIWFSGMFYIIQYEINIVHTKIMYHSSGDDLNVFNILIMFVKVWCHRMLNIIRHKTLKLNSVALADPKIT